MSRQIVLTTVFAMVLILGGLFAWRVFYFYQKIQTGDVIVSDLDFSERLTTGKLINKIQNLPESNVNVASTDDPALGSSNAILTIVEFGDFGCPYTREASYTVRRLTEQYGDKLHYIYRDFPLDDVHPQARLAAEAGECASEQDQFFAYHDKLFQNQHDLSPGSLIQYAAQIGLDVDLFTECLNSGKYADEVQRDLEDGQAAGVYGTPTFFFNGQKVEGAIPENVFAQIIEAYVNESSN